MHTHVHTQMCLVTSSVPIPLPWFRLRHLSLRSSWESSSMSPCHWPGLPAQGHQLRFVKYQPDPALRCFKSFCPHLRHFQGKAPTLSPPPA